MIRQLSLWCLVLFLKSFLLGCSESPSEAELLNSALKSEVRVQVYTYKSYEGIFDNVQIWLDDDGYLKFSILDFSKARDGEISGLIEQVDNVKIECTSSLDGTLRGLPTVHLLTILGIEDGLTLAGIIENYDGLSETIKNWSKISDNSDDTAVPDIKQSSIECDFASSHVPRMDNGEKRKNLFIR